MARRGLIDRLIHQRDLLRWGRAARGAATADLGRLRTDRARAQALRHRLDELIAVAEGRLALPRIGSTSFPRPAGTDWSWRPRLWRGPLPRKGLAAVESRTAIGEEATLFHDCAVSELTLRQIRNQREGDLAPFGLRLDVFRFDGTFLSLALDLPDGACEGLRRRHLIRLDIALELERRLDVFARLNVRHGPNTETILRELPLHQGPPWDHLWVEFDLAYSKLNEKRVEAMWLDLIFEGPEMNQITIRDLTLSRHPRAEL